jgi:hypothetical protein
MKTLELARTFAERVKAIEVCVEVNKMLTLVSLDPSLHAKFSQWAGGAGLMGLAIGHGLQFASVSVSHNVLTRYSLLFITTEFEFIVQRMARKLLRSPTRWKAWYTMVCNHDLSQIERDKVGRKAMVSLLVSCLQHQSTFEFLLVREADVNVAHPSFGYTAAHHVAALGDERLFDMIAQHRPNLHARTLHGHTPLHLAVIRCIFPSQSVR